MQDTALLYYSTKIHAKVLGFIVILTCNLALHTKLPYFHTIYKVTLQSSHTFILFIKLYIEYKSWMGRGHL